LDVSNPILIIVTGRLLLVVVANNRSLAQLMPSGAVHPNTGELGDARLQAEAALAVLILCQPEPSLARSD